MPAEPSPSAPHVLIIGDDPLLRELVAALLSQDRFTVAEAADVSEAEVSARTRAPSVVLLDAIVDGAVARPVLERADLFGPQPPAIVVLVGAGTPPEVQHHAYVDSVLPLPLTAELLVGVIRHHATWRPRRQIQSGTHSRVDLSLDAEASRAKTR